MLDAELVEEVDAIACRVTGNPAPYPGYLFAIVLKHLPVEEAVHIIECRRKYSPLNFTIYDSEPQLGYLLRMVEKYDIYIPRYVMKSKHYAVFLENGPVHWTAVNEMRELILWVNPRVYKQTLEILGCSHVELAEHIRSGDKYTSWLADVVLTRLMEWNLPCF